MSADITYQIRDLAQANEHMAQVGKLAEDAHERDLAEHAWEATRNITATILLMSRRIKRQGKEVYKNDRM